MGCRGKLNGPGFKEREKEESGKACRNRTNRGKDARVGFCLANYEVMGDTQIVTST